jgi:hypothetical protein
VVQGQGVDAPVAVVDDDVTSLAGALVQIHAELLDDAGPADI